jgi:hypothetical protein
VPDSCGNIPVVQATLNLVASLSTTYSMTNHPKDRHYHSVVRNRWRLSFQSSAASTSQTVSTNDTGTGTSLSTIRGIGSLTGKALLAFGKATLRGGSAIVIQARLQTLKSQFPHGDSYESPNLPIAYRDVLELSRYVSSSSFDSGCH